MSNVTIIGFGWVGKATQKLFPEAYIYDPPLGYGEKEEVNKRDVAFIAIPTPCSDKGKLDTSIMEEIVSWCKCPLLVIRSALNPGDCEFLSKKYKRHIVYQPEYLGETPSHPFSDFRTRQFLVLGGKPEDRRKLIDLYTTVYNANTRIRQVTSYEAEVIKLSENRAIFYKLVECRELHDACQKGKLDYYTVRDAVYSDDPRFNLWWTFFFPDKKGFNSKCIPKDIYAWAAWAESVGYQPKVTKALLEKNEEWIAEGGEVKQS